MNIGVMNSLPPDVDNADAARPMPRTLGIFGGSFDPPHMAHVFVAVYALSAGEIDALLVVPTFKHAFGKDLLPYEHRLRMCELAMLPLRDVEVSTIERELSGISYMIRTLEVIQDQYPDHALRLIVGSDVMNQIPQWKEGERVMTLAPPLLVGRRGVSADESEVPFELPPITSAELRRRLRLGLDVNYLIPRRVLDYILSNKLYTKD